MESTSVVRHDNEEVAEPVQEFFREVKAVAPAPTLSAVKVDGLVFANGKALLVFTA